MKLKTLNLLLFISIFFIFSCKKETLDITKIAFGSCGDQDWPQPVLSLAADLKPDAFIFLGDNIYGDTDVMDTLRNKYKRWAAQPDYKNLESSTKIFATWDDHDYGRNDSGRNYPFKKESKEIFMNHFKIDANHEMKKHDGIYHTNYIEKNGKKVQLIMLDVRYFRSNVLLYDGKTKMPREQYFYKLDYMPHTSPDSTFLGSEQWKWLEQELKKPADLRLICSGSQFGIEFNGYEAWANYPHEQKRMLELIKSTKANGVMFLTGDVHYAEVSKLKYDGLYPIYDVTASGITSTWDFAALNKNRIEGPVMENHFGLLTIEWAMEPKIKMEIIDHTGNSRIEHTINSSEIKF
jgi:alkaline phosphatase D